MNLGDAVWDLAEPVATGFSIDLLLQLCSLIFVNGNKFEIVAPVYSRLMARGAGKNVKGIFASTNWHWSPPDDGSKAFVKSFGEKYGFPPSQAAHTVYCQTLLYGDAVECAGMFNSFSVGEALEGFKFSGLGNGEFEYAPDHPIFTGGSLGKCNPGAQDSPDCK